MWRSISRFTWSVFEFQQYQEGPERRDNDGTVWPKEELGDVAQRRLLRRHSLRGRHEYWRLLAREAKFKQARKVTER